LRFPSPVSHQLYPFLPQDGTYTEESRTRQRRKRTIHMRRPTRRLTKRPARRPSRRP
jgi:hypothetical protein